MNKEELIKFLKENLSIEIETDSVYTGGMDGPLYKDIYRINLLLENEVISSTWTS